MVGLLAFGEIERKRAPKLARPEADNSEIDEREEGRGIELSKMIN